MSDSDSAALFTDVAGVSDIADGKLLGVELPDGTRVCGPLANAAIVMERGA